MENMSEIYYQTANRKYVENNYGKSQWVQISGDKELNGAVAGFWCALLKKDKVDVVFKNHSWDVSIGSGAPGFECYEGKCEYRSSFLEDGFEYLLHYREFYGVKESFVELAQEFVLLNNLYFDEYKKIYYAMLEDGSSDEVVRIEGNDIVFINLSYLNRYAAAKQMAVILFFDIRTNFDVDTMTLEVKEFLEEYRDKNVYYKIWGGDLSGLKRKACSVLMGKRIIYPQPVETCGYWPFERRKNYMDFIVGVDENGNEITFTCNPDKLGNYFGSNPDAPHYLTPVFFKREVLLKYISHPELYSVCDGSLVCRSLWRLHIDDHHKDCISVYLGDLGTYLPESEWMYWRSYNIASDEGVSETSFKRDFLGVFADSNMTDHKFKEHYVQTNNAWNNKFGWKLFLPLTENDQYNFDLLRIPLTESQEEFDRLVLSLVKVIIDSLNEKSIQKQIVKEEGDKGLDKLKKWFESMGYVKFEDHIKFLRDLQTLRSRGTGHRKGTDYDKIATSFGVGKHSLVDVFEKILARADAFLTYMNDIATDSESVRE